MIALLNVRPERQGDLHNSEVLITDPPVPVRQFIDSFGNVASRFVVPQGGIRLSSDFVIADSGTPDEVAPEAIQHRVQDLPDDVLLFLMSSRYCEVGLLVVRI